MPPSSAPEARDAAAREPESAGSPRSDPRSEPRSDLGDDAFRALMHASLDGIVLFDHEGRILDINPVAETMFGISRDAARGRSVAEVTMPARWWDAQREGLAAYLRTGESPHIGRRVETIGVRSTGEEFPIELTVLALRPALGPPIFVRVVRDLSEQRRAQRDIAALHHARDQDELVQDELRRARDVAENARRELEAFSYSVAHDLRAPLRAIHGYQAALIEDHAAALDQEAKAYLARIGAGATRMSELIDALLGLARVGRSEMVREPVSLTHVAQGVVALLRAQEPEREVIVEIEDDLLVEGDARLLLALLQNLLGNAWKFTARVAAPRIELKRADYNGVAAFVVRDNGAGFDMAYAAKLFAPFQRLHSTREFGGTGIGLATVQRIVHRHGGEVWARGEVGGGAELFFVLDDEGREAWQAK
jgi:PAS domain S-box-containing protein